MLPRILLIGEASSKVGGKAFDGRPGRFLADLAGCTLEEFLTLVEAVNLLDRPQPLQRGGKGRTFDASAAKRSAALLPLRGRTVVLAGKRVAAAFGLRDPAWLRSVDLGRGERAAWVIPHPSGIVRWYNNGANRLAASKLLQRLLNENG